MRGLLAYLIERWDGHGPLGRAKGEEIPLPMRIVHVAVDAAFQRLLGGEERVGAASSASAPGMRSTRRWPPASPTTPRAILALDDARLRVGRDARRASRTPPLMLEGDALDRGLAAMGNFADLISPYLAGHSAGVAELAAAAARRCRIDDARRRPRSGARRSSTTSDGSRSTRGSGRSRGR